jgi:hypothetical protein
MIKYCLSAILLVACSGVGTKEPNNIAPDPLPVIALQEIEVRESPLFEPLKTKPIRRAAVNRRPPCDESSDDKKEEFLLKLDCVKRLTEKDDA